MVVSPSPARPVCVVWVVRCWWCCSC